MKIFLTGAIFTVFFSSIVLAQTTTIIIPNSSPTPPTQTKRPPVLIGDTNSTKPAPSQTPPKDDVAVEDDEVIRIETNLVTIPVSVLDRNGRFISGLQQEDFQIFEDNKLQKIEYFAPVEQPFTVVLMIDISPSTQYKINEIQDAAIAFVDQLRRDDRVVVMAFDRKVQVLSPATNNRAVLRNAILQTAFGDGTSLYEAVDFAVNNQLRQIEGRKAVVIFTDGVDTTSKRANYQSTLRDVEEADALIYPIRYDTFRDMNRTSSGGGNFPNPQPRRRSTGSVWGDILGGILGGGNVTIGGSQRGGGSAGSSQQEYETGRRYLEDLSRLSGGRIFEANYSLRSAFTGIAEELRQQYSIGYYPENVGELGQRKQVRVRVNRTSAVVRARNSYIVGENDPRYNNTATRKPPQTIQPPRQTPKIVNRIPF